MVWQPAPGLHSIGGMILHIAAVEWDRWPRTLRWVLGHVIQHEGYHGWQAVLLSRLWQVQ